MPGDGGHGCAHEVHTGGNHSPPLRGGVSLDEVQDKHSQKEEREVEAQYISFQVPVPAGRAHVGESAVPKSDGNNDLPVERDEHTEHRDRNSDGIDEDRDVVAQGGADVFSG